MGIRYENLDGRTRDFMTKELEIDTSKKTLYISPRLNYTGQVNWANILGEAIQNYNDVWLAHELRTRGYMKSQEEKKHLAAGQLWLKFL